MIIDCAGCVMRDLACGECVVSFLLGPPVELGSAEQTALAVLADGGLVPPLQMRPAADAPSAGNRQRTGPAASRRPGAASA
jgi:hypothetical protein